MKHDSVDTYNETPALDRCCWIKWLESWFLGIFGQDIPPHAKGSLVTKAIDASGVSCGQGWSAKPTEAGE